VKVAGKTGSLSGRNPDGRYEWFVGAAPAEAPRIVVASVVVQTDLYWLTASQVSAEVLKAVFCPKGVCRNEAVQRFAGTP
jgi:cell division protein FtsI/penicillin-binding protein 2